MSGSSLYPGFTITRFQLTVFCFGIDSAVDSFSIPRCTATFNSPSKVNAPLAYIIKTNNMHLKSANKHL